MPREIHFENLVNIGKGNLVLFEDLDPDLVRYTQFKTVGATGALTRDTTISWRGAGCIKMNIQGALKLIDAIKGLGRINPNYPVELEMRWTYPDKDKMSYVTWYIAQYDATGYDLAAFIFNPVNDIIQISDLEGNDYWSTFEGWKSQYHLWYNNENATYPFIYWHYIKIVADFKAKKYKLFVCDEDQTGEGVLDNISAKPLGRVNNVVAGKGVATVGMEIRTINDAASNINAYLGMVRVTQHIN